MLQETQWAVCNMNYFNTIIPYNTKKNNSQYICRQCYFALSWLISTAQNDQAKILAMNEFKQAHKKDLEGRVDSLYCTVTLHSALSLGMKNRLTLHQILEMVLCTLTPMSHEFQRWALIPASTRIERYNLPMVQHMLKEESGGRQGRPS